MIREIFMLLAYLLVYFHYTCGEESMGEGKNGKSGRKILVFGGNGFIGSEAVRRLLDKGDEITIVNRGNWYFDSDQRIKPFVKEHFICDRDMRMRTECKEILTSGYYDAVIDFSSYNARQLKQVVEILHDRVGLYVYISTDSIYEVCEKTHSGPSVEEDAVRPKNRKKRLQLKREEGYAHDKLACEEVLEEQRKSSGFPYVALRLPDVIGPRDNSFRFWTYQLWIRIHKDIKHPVHMPSSVSDTKFSLIHVEDAAKAIEKVLDVGPAVHNQAINVAFDEHFTLKKLLRDMADKMNIDQLEFISQDEETWYSYPTVTKGPLDISKAKLLLGWEPMTWERALYSLIFFFEGAMTDAKFLREREVLLADVFENIIPEELYETALKKLVSMYGKDVLEGVAMDIAPEIEGEIHLQNSSSVHDQKSAETGTKAQSPAVNEDVEEIVADVDSDSEAELVSENSKTTEIHSDEL